MTRVETGSSANVFAGVLSKRGEDGLLHPIAFFKKHIAQEINHEICDGELLATIGRCFEQWRQLESSRPAIEILRPWKFGSAHDYQAAVSSSSTLIELFLALQVCYHIQEGKLIATRTD